MAYALSKKLVERGHKVVVYTTDAKDMNSRINKTSAERDGIEIHYFRNVSMITVKKSKLFITPYLVSKVKKEIQSFDIVHIHEYRTFQNLIVHHYAKKYGVPYILQAHGSLPWIMKKQSLKRFFDAVFGYKLLIDAAKVFALSSVEAEQYMLMGVPEEKIAIIPNGINLSEYAFLPPKMYFKNKFRIGDYEKIMLYVGRIHESKGLDLLAHAFKIVSETVSDVRLVIVGPDDGYSTRFRELISSLGIVNKVLFTGFIEKRDKLGAFVDSDVFVTPYFSGFPITFLEACISGCPIVTMSDELDWINENVGFVTKRNLSDFSEAIIKILSNEQIKEQFKTNCINTIRKFDASVVTSQIEKQYCSVA